MNGRYVMVFKIFINTKLCLKVFFTEGGVGLVPKRECLLMLAYYAFLRGYLEVKHVWNTLDYMTKYVSLQI
jgi:hypothetical protein